MLFCSMMHVASGVFAWCLCLGVSAYFCGFLQVRRKPFRLCYLNVSVLQGTPSNKARYGQNCVSPNTKGIIMDDDRKKATSSSQGGQVSQGQLRQVSQLFGEGTVNTDEWTEIHRTNDEWEVKLIQATLSAQQIRCRPIELKQERQTALLVAPEHEVEAMELVSRIGVAVADNEMAMRSEETAEALKQRDMAVVQDETQQSVLKDSTELLIAEREGSAVSSTLLSEAMNSVSVLNPTSPLQRRIGKNSQISVRSVKSSLSFSVTNIPTFLSGFKMGNYWQNSSDSLR